MYSFKITAIKMLKGALIILLATLLSTFEETYPQIATMTIGGLFIGLLDWLKHKIGVKI